MTICASSYFPTHADVLFLFLTMAMLAPRKVCIFSNNKIQRESSHLNDWKCSEKEGGNPLCNKTLPREERFGKPGRQTEQLPLPEEFSPFSGEYINALPGLVRTHDILLHHWKITSQEVLAYSSGCAVQRIFPNEFNSLWESRNSGVREVPWDTNDAVSDLVPSWFRYRSGKFSILQYRQISQISCCYLLWKVGAFKLFLWRGRLWNIWNGDLNPSLPHPSGSICWWAIKVFDLSP